MLRIRKLFAVVLLALFFPGVSFSQTPRLIESNDPYFAPRADAPSNEGSSARDNDFVKPQGFIDPNAPLKRPAKTQPLQTLEGSGSSGFAAPTQPPQFVSPPAPTDFRPASVAGRNVDTRLPGLSDTPPQEQTEQETLNEFAPGQVVAIVGGEPIFVGDILFEANQMIEQRAANAPEKIKKELRGQVIKRLIPKFVDSKMLWVDTLADLPEEADVDDILENASAEFDSKALPAIMKSVGATSVQDFDTKLRSQNSSLRQFRDNWARDQLMRYFMSEKLQVNVDVSHAELLAYYRENRETYLTKARVRWEEIAIRYSKTPDRAEARRLITELGNEVVYGAPLPAVAKRGSQGFTAMEGGQHDWTGKGALVYTEVDEALFTIPPGELSEIIESRDGLHIVRVLEREDDSITPFTEAQGEIRKKIEAQKRTAAFEKHLTGLRKRIPFEIILPDVELPPHLAEQVQESNWR